MTSIFTMESIRYPILHIYTLNFIYIYSLSFFKIHFPGNRPIGRVRFTRNCYMYVWFGQDKVSEKSSHVNRV